jgi:hypothetical protein
MIVVSADKCADRDYTVSTRTIFNYYRLSPAHGEPIRK